MLAERHQGRHVSTAFALTHYLVDRIGPADTQARNWLVRIWKSIAGLNLPNDASLASALLLAISTDTQARGPERARRFLLRNGIDPNDFELELDAALAFVDALSPEWNGGQFLEHVREAKTAGEEVRALLKAADENGAREGFEQLKQSLYWPKLLRVLEDPARRARICVIDTPQDICPKCRLTMPTASQQDLRVLGVTEHCRLILCKAI